MSGTLFIDGEWCKGAGGRSAPVLDPATGLAVGTVDFAEAADLDRALAAVARTAALWAATSAFERCAIVRKAATLMRERAESLARAISGEQGKPLAEARTEVMASADHVDWNAEEGRRAYGRVIPARSPEVLQLVVKEPIGPVAAFSPWNFPLTQLVRKVAAALAAGCPVIGKAPEETPTSAVEMVRCFVDAGVPAGVLNLVFGVPAEISEHLIASPVIGKVSFTGSVAVGRHLGALSARHLKRTTMELGGHAPFIVSDTADVAGAAALALALKFRNAGQVCASPTRFLVHERVFEDFTGRMVAGAEALVVGPGTAAGTTMGPLAHARRIDAIAGFVNDAVACGADLRTGGRRLGNAGFFYAPTVLADVPLSARIMNEEPFGPVAVVNRVGSLDEAIAESNRLSLGLSSFAFTRSLEEADRIAKEVRAGTVSINHVGLGLPEIPFGGIRDSGHGSEGGTEGLAAYLQDKLISQRRAA